MLSVNVEYRFYRPKDKLILADKANKMFYLCGGDHLAILNIYNQWANTDFNTNWCYENFIQHRTMHRARDIRNQLVALKQRV